MIRLKMIFGLGLAMAIILLCMFAPAKTMDRFVLPDGCCNACARMGESLCNVCICENGKKCNGCLCR